MEENHTSKQLSDILAELSPNQIRFVVEMPNHPNIKQCAEYLDIDPSTVYNWKKKVDLDGAIEAMRENVIEGALEIRKKALTKAVLVKLKGLESEDEKTRQKVATEIIEWETGKAGQPSDYSNSSKNDADNVLPSLPAELIAPDFLKVHRDIVQKLNKEYVVKGGRGSTKSSFVSLEIISLIINNPEFNALALRNNANTLRDSVYAQLTWAISMLEVSDYFKSTVSPAEIEYLPTGQKIYFRGADKPEKLKGIIPKVGYVAILWLEELDQFRGQAALRNIKQTAIRGGEEAYTFLTYNPPRSANNWVNRYALIPKPGQYQHTSDYRNVPKEWLGQPFIDEAEHLLSINEKAYLHEYIGEVTGTGGQVFDNIEVRAITDEEIATFGESLHGNDWGYFPDPYSYGKMYYDSARLTLYIFGEFRSYKQSNTASYESIKENGYNDAELLIADSAEPKSIADYAGYGAWVRGAEKGAGSVVYSMKWLQSRAKIVCDPRRAPFHTQEFTEYELEQDKNGEFISAYPDKNNHAIDDARYATNLIWRRRGE